LHLEFKLIMNPLTQFLSDEGHALKVLVMGCSALFVIGTTLAVLAIRLA